MKKEDDGAVPLSLPPPPIAAATVAHPRCPPQMMLVFSRFSPKKVPFEDTTEAVVVEAEAAAQRATAEVGQRQDMGRMRTMAVRHRRPHLTPPPRR